MVCIGSVIAVGWTYARFDSYETKWTHESPLAAGIVRSSYVDTYRRGGTRPCFRRVLSEAGDSVFRRSGPMAGETKPHGKWTEFAYGASPMTMKVIFYWYGDEVTEGEWHLRAGR